MKRLSPLTGAPALALFGALSLLLVAQDAWAASNVADAIKLPDDPTKAYFTLGILAIAVVMFFTECVPLACTAILVPVALSLTGIFGWFGSDATIKECLKNSVLTSKEAFANWGNPTVILFMAMFIVGEATFVTGFADKVGALAMKLSRGKERLLLLFSMLSVGLLSTVLSDTGTAAVALPMVLAMCMKTNIAPAKILLPMACASSLGGTVTLVGTPPNGITNAMLESNQVLPFSFFEFGKIGIPLLIAGLLYYYFIGHRLLPGDRRTDEDDAALAADNMPRRSNKMFVAIGIFAFVVLMMATEILPLSTAAMLGAALVVASGCLTMKEAYRAVDWNTIFLFAGMLSMSTAMDGKHSGAAAIVAHAVVSLVDNPWMLQLACCALTAILTNFMSNTATAALMAPLAITIAHATGVSPLPLAMGICACASTCFLTPIATPANTIVFGPGKYKFLDYAKAGWPLQLITLLMCWLLVPLIWPFGAPVPAVNP